ncbi:hypothetical protein D3C87_2191200 [compost metagenome]
MTIVSWTEKPMMVRTATTRRPSASAPNSRLKIAKVPTMMTPSWTMATMAERAKSNW